MSNYSTIDHKRNPLLLKKYRDREMENYALYLDDIEPLMSREELFWEELLDPIKYHHRITPEEKAFIFEHDLERRVKKYRKALFQKKDQVCYEIYQEMLDEYNPVVVKNAFKVEDSNRHKDWRLKRRIEKLFSCGPCYFLTLTFDDRKLEKIGISLTDISKENTKKLERYCREYLKKIGPYCANIDFGKQNERLHFHAVVLSYERIECGPENEWFKKFGAIKVEQIRKGKDDSFKLAKYINKLTNHAIKETVRNNSMMYSRGLDQFLFEHLEVSED